MTKASCLFIFSFSFSVHLFSQIGISFPKLRNDSTEYAILGKQQDSLIFNLIGIIEDTTYSDSIKVEAVYLLGEIQDYDAIHYLLANIEKTFPYEIDYRSWEEPCLIALHNKPEKWFFLSSLLKFLEEQDYKDNENWSYGRILFKKFDKETIITILNYEFSHAYKLSAYYRNLSKVIQVFKN